MLCWHEIGEKYPGGEYVAYIEYDGDVGIFMNHPWKHESTNIEIW